MGISEVRFENGRTQRAGPIVVRAFEVIAASHEQRIQLSEIPMDTRFMCPDASLQLDSSVAHAISTRSDGNRNVRQIADSCGLTLHETIINVEKLLADGVLEVAEPTEDQDVWQTQAPFADAPRKPTTRHLDPGALSAADSAVADTLEVSSSTSTTLPSSPTPSTAETATTLRAQPSSEQPSGPVTSPSTQPGTANPADRRDLMSNLSALSADAPLPPAQAIPEPSAPERHPKPPLHDRGTDYGQRQPTANPGAASEMFQELRSLAYTGDASNPPEENEQAETSTPTSDEDPESAATTKKRRRFGL
jgi:hypothetical protein